MPAGAALLLWLRTAGSGSVRRSHIRGGRFASLISFLARRTRNRRVRDRAGNRPFLACRDDADREDLTIQILFGVGGSRVDQYIVARDGYVMVGHSQSFGGIKLDDTEYSYVDDRTRPD
jgi:hypothetical protein